jgi:hypothetical protein
VPVAFLLAALVGLAFGAGDQYLGSMLWLGPWTSTVAQMSAPWLVLPFVVGTTQERPRRAIVLGSVATAAALLGYFAMTYSPLEVHPWSFDRFTTGLVAVTTSGYNPAYILGGMATGPVFGLLGQRWRVRRSWVSAALVAGALSLEPLARLATGQLPHAAPPVWAVEVAVGVSAAVILARNASSARRLPPPS